MNYLEEMFGLKERVAVITGGGGVLAGSMAEALLKAGAGVSLWGRGHESLDAAISKLSAATGLGCNIQKVVVAKDNVRFYFVGEAIGPERRHGRLKCFRLIEFFMSCH